MDTYDYRINYHHQLRRYLKWTFYKWITRDDVASRHPTWINRNPKFKIEWHYTKPDRWLAVGGELCGRTCAFHNSENQTFYELLKVVMYWGFAVHFEGEYEWIYSRYDGSVKVLISEMDKISV